MERRAALRPVYAAIIARLGPPTLLGGTDHGPSVRWVRPTRTLLLSGDHGAAVLSVHDSARFAEREYAEFVEGGLPYAWALDRGGPGGGRDRWLNDSSVARTCTWQDAEERPALLLASWAEHLPVQAPGDWAGMRLRARWNPPVDLVVTYDPGTPGREPCAVVPGPPPTPETAERMRGRGWQGTDPHNRWYIRLPETDPRAPAEVARVVTAELRAGPFDYPNEVFASDISAGDDGTLVVPGLGFEVTLRREHF
ncbi:hypothetical protein ACFPZ0_20830 [Streptomonospora nanhaiensis]|uniref:hypothetical protein n=1 Tax=Streptomonospora nanhaiensis TaxID=1323731 RepID=UPI001C997BCC|nr:hypothetical protein [Streptomonospora nanhaiensis]MBX9391226.1 hypothetical protein [Streptomonospora nanhaiensis]